MRYSWLALLVAIAGCAGPSTPAPPPTSKSVWKGTSVKEPPPVTEAALDVNAYEKDPCQILGLDWLEDYGVPPHGGIARNQQYGITCDWPATGGHRGITIGVVVRGRQGGLNKVYLNETRYREFKPGTISGYPSVVATPKDWPATACVTHVATGDHAGFEAYADVLDPKAAEYACTASGEVAAAVIERLKMPR